MANSESLIHGVPAEFWNETKVPVVIGSCAFMVTMTVFCISLRFYARYFARSGFWWDDWLALASVPFCLLSPIFDFIQINNGFGRHQVVWINTDPGKLVAYAKTLYVVILFYNPGLAFFKWSLLALYLRLFPVIPWLRYTCYLLSTLIAMWIVGTEFAAIFRCNPISANWIPTEGTCISQKTIFIAQSIPTIFFDIAILLIPIRLIWNLRMARSSRIGVLAVFLLGCLVTIISIIRLVSTLTSSNTDLTWGYVDLGLWSGAEPITGLLCCCLPSYSPLLRAGLRRLGLSTKIGSYGDNSGKMGDSRGAHRTIGSTRTGAVKPGHWADVVAHERTDQDSDEVELTHVRDKGSPHGETFVTNGSSERQHVPYGEIQVTQEISVLR